jgi:hypothetical protein
VSAPMMSRECGSACFDICKQKPDRRRESRLKKSFDEVPLDRRLIILSRSIFWHGNQAFQRWIPRENEEQNRIRVYINVFSRFMTIYSRLMDQNIGPAGAVALAEAIKVNNTITSLV